MNNKTLEIRIFDEISITDVFYYIKKVIKEVIKKIVKQFKNIVIKDLFGNINNYSNPPNQLIRTKSDESFKNFNLLLFFTIEY